jgi:hypothetical protein
MEGFTSGKALPDPARKPTAPGTVFPGGRKGGRKAIRPIRAWEQLRWRWSKDKKRMVVDLCDWFCHPVGELPIVGKVTGW